MSNDFLDSRKKAKFQHECARHLLHVTYPMVKDPKLLMGVVNNLVISFEHAIDAILAYERQLHLIPIYGSTFQSKLHTFQRKSVKRNKIDPRHISLLLDLKQLQEMHKNCPVEFQRGNRLILATKEYKMQSLSMDKLQKWLYQTKDFLDKTDDILHLAIEKHKN
ncbi:hypothetical protein HOI26_01030 [Candidatus Woesearchaeota archaeon]|jgi:hypothetical protein|nr:hypothetical protein [Candidatus Woesearchaeota archaeon]MBT5739658.1 hypothetical protein [Candidatus Woesearchaeota archaeon]